MLTIRIHNYSYVCSPDNLRYCSWNTEIQLSSYFLVVRLGSFILWLLILGPSCNSIWSVFSSFLILLLLTWRWWRTVTPFMFLSLQLVSSFTVSSHFFSAFRSFSIPFSTSSIVLSTWSACNILEDFTMIFSASSLPTTFFRLILLTRYLPPLADTNPTFISTFALKWILPYILYSVHWQRIIRCSHKCKFTFSA